MATDRVQCRLCRFWEGGGRKTDAPSRATFGICRRRAPQPGIASVTWPRTGAEEWCGDHQPRDVQPQAPTPVAMKPLKADPSLKS